MFGRAPTIAGSLLVALGAALFLWKAAWLDLPMLPSATEGPWRVELEVTARGSARGSVRAALPFTSPAQVIFDETSAPDRLLFAIRTHDESRTGIWSGRLRGVHLLAYGFRVELADPAAVTLPEGALPPPPEEIAKAHSRETPAHPVRAPEVAALLASMDLAEDPADRVRRVFGFVADEVALTPNGSEDALLTLNTREGSAVGRVRLLVTLLRTAGVPARPVAGIQLESGATPRPRAWAEAWLGERWIPVAPSQDGPGRAPEDTVVLRRGALALVEATGVEAVSHRWRALREHLRPAELATMMVPSNPALARLSLYRLPVETQQALRTLLLLPLGALVVALFRNVIGVPTFGTFMPILIALALRSISLVPGLAMTLAVIAVGIGGRLALERLHLLFVPRLSILLCMVVLAVTAFALIATGTEMRNFFAGALLPMVILTMLVERVSVTLTEEGTRPTLVQAGWSIVVAVAAYPLFRSARAEHLMFGFPELVVVISGVLVWIGGYTGYRVSDLVRFRSLATEDET